MIVKYYLSLTHIGKDLIVIITLLMLLELDIILLYRLEPKDMRRKKAVRNIFSIKGYLDL